MLAWFVVTIVLYKFNLPFASILGAAMLGLTVGLYFGDYKGRYDVMEAWRNELNAEHKEDISIAEEFFRTERERIRRQEVCSDKSHWRKV